MEQAFKASSTSETALPAFAVLKQASMVGGDTLQGMNDTSSIFSRLVAAMALMCRFRLMLR
jgi:hypothetical protein